MRDRDEPEDERPRAVVRPREVARAVVRLAVVRAREAAPAVLRLAVVRRLPPPLLERLVVALRAVDRLEDPPP